MKKIIFVTFLLITAFSLSNCSTPDDDVELAVSQANRITRFRVYRNINEYYDASISHLEETIILSIPSSMKIDKLQPEIIISNGATVSPASGVVQDFTNSPIIYKVVSEDGLHVKEYKVTLKNDLN